MNEVRRVLRAAAWRLFALDLVRTFLITASAGVAGLVVLRLVQQVFGLSLTQTQWWQYAGIAAAVSLVAALLWSSILRHKQIAVARELDERAELRESLSTALCVEKNPDPWAKAVVDTARERATRVDVRRAIPIEAPRFWPTPVALGLALAVVWWTFPRMDVLGLFQKKQDEQAHEHQLQQAKMEVKQNEQRIEELLKKANVDLKANEKAESEESQQSEKSAEQVRAQAVKKLTSLQDKLNELKQGDKAQQMEAIKNALKQMKQPGPGPMEELSKALSQGNFAKAQEELGELAKKVNDGTMTPAEKEQAKQQLQKMSEQLAKLSENTNELEKTLEKAGLSKEDAAKLAKDPQALKEALEKMDSLSEEQKQQLMKAAEKQSAACKACEGMSESIGKMSQGMGNEGMTNEGMEGMEGMAGQLSEMEMMAGEMDALDAAMSECAGMLKGLGQGMCKGGGDGELMASEMNGLWGEGDSNKFGKGSGGPGKGMGGGGTAEEAPTTTEKAMAKTKMQQGPIVGSRLVYGDQIKGESVAEFSEAVEAASVMATESVETMQVPREYQDAVKQYFGRLQAKVKAQPAGAPAAAPGEGK